MPALLMDAWTHGEVFWALLLGLALVHLLVCAVVLTWVDLREHRLPNRWTLALALGGAVSLWSASALHGGERLVPSVVGLVGYPVLMLLLHLASRGGLGLGDVKLAGGLGLYTGWLGWEAWAQAVFLGFVIGGVVALVMVLSRRATGSTRLAFGPPLLAGALAAVLLV